MIVIYLYFHPLVVPAVYKEPDIKIYKGDNTKELVLIERGIEYHATWDPEILNINEFNENDSISFDIQNWIFGIRQNKLIDRKERTNRDVLKIISDQTTKGMITFNQDIGNLAGGTFDMSLLVLIKKTKNLKISYTSTLLSFLDKDIISVCQTWYEQTDDKLYSSNVSSCPCNMKSAIFDSDFESDPTCSVTKTECHENVNANHCYLRNISKYVIIYIRINELLSYYIVMYAAV